jgi:predicted negative regulator of RcsB-dependent stress response
LALDLEEQGRDYKAALRRVDTIIEMAPRTDRWLMRRGDILTAAGRMDDARKAYRAALAALDDLPESQRRTIASTELRRDIEARLAGKSSGVEPSRP